MRAHAFCLAGALTSLLALPALCQDADTADATSTSPRARASSYLPYDADVYNWLDKAAILNGGTLTRRLGSARPYQRADVAALADSLSPARFPNSREQALARFIRRDNNELFADSLTRSRKPIMGVLYRNPADAYSYRSKSFDVHLSPVAYGWLGKESQRDGIYSAYFTPKNEYINTRGIELRGTIDGRVSFYTYLADNQAQLPSYVNRYAYRFTGQFPNLPQEGYQKPLNQTGTDGKGYDFITARGHIAFQATRHVAVSFGNDRFFVGDGMRSLVLSDQAPAFPFLRLDTKVWRVRYTNLFAQLKAGGRQPADKFIPTKYAAFHQLEVQVARGLNLSLFESVIIAPGDTTRRGFFDVSYLNPLIFYRSVEQNNGSADNSLLGAGWRYDFLHQFRFYGQFVLDEFQFKNLKAQNGWWANKYAIQAGLKWINPFGIPGLDVQGEYNFIRPFTYSHEDKYRSYTSYNQPLAHPGGANLQEFIGRATYQLLPNLRLHARGFIMKTGYDYWPDGLAYGSPSNYGQNIFRSYNDKRAQEFGNTVGQGETTTIRYAQLMASYQVFHRIFLEAALTYRTISSPPFGIKTQPDLAIFSFGLRWNAAPRYFEF